MAVSVAALFLAPPATAAGVAVGPATPARNASPFAAGVPGRAAEGAMQEAADDTTFGTLTPNTEAPLRWGVFLVESPVPPAAVDWDGRLGIEGKLVEGTPFAPALERLLRLYARAGYPFVSVSPQRFDLMGDRVTGVLRIDPGVAARVEGLRLEGARVTRPGTGRRLAGLVKDAPYTGDLRSRVRQRLLRSGLFATVGEVVALPGETPEAVVLRTKVSEPPYTRFSGVLGVSGANARVTGLVDLELVNLAGTAREASGRWENRGDGLTRFRLAYREPWLPVVPIGVAGKLKHDINEGVYSFTDWEVSGDLRFSGTWRVALGYGGSRAVRPAEAGFRTSETFVTAGLEWDRRDAAFLPTRGFRINLRSRRGTKEFFREGETQTRVDRVRWLLEGEAYHRWGARWLGALTTDFRFLDSPEDSIPRYDLFALGGANSLRGYREEQFLTAASWTVRSELRLMQDERGSAVFGFADAALFAPSLEAGTRDRLQRFLLGYGVGVRQASRLGVLGVAYGIARGDGPLDGRIHLRIDTVF